MNRQETQNESDQKCLQFDISQPLEKQNQTDFKNKNDADLQGLNKKILSTLSTFVGVYLTYASALIISQVFIADLADISKPSLVFLTFIIGIVFIILGIGRVKTRKDLLLCLSVPYMSFILGYLFTLAPENWHGKLFGGFSLFFYIIMLFIFYYLKERFASDEKKSNFV